MEVLPVPYNELSDVRRGEPSSEIRKRVVAARKIQEERFAEYPTIYSNAQMTTKLLQQYCSLDQRSHEALHNAMRRLGLSARAYDRILKVARTIADLDGSDSIGYDHLSEAINYRSLDRDNWGS